MHSGQNDFNNSHLQDRCLNNSHLHNRFLHYRYFYNHFIVLFLAGLLLASPYAQSEKKLQKVAYGGAFELTNHQGNSVTEKDFIGQYMLVYFGYTNCPDICPTGLFTIATAIDDLGPKGEQITPLFITVDPQRDTPKKLASYVKAFHPRMVGLSGNTRSTAKAAKAYNVMYSVLQIEGKYLVSHTGQIYLVGPDGQFIGKFHHDITPAQLSTQLQQHIGASN